MPLSARPVVLPSPAAPADPVAKPSPVPQRRLEAQGPSPVRSSPGAALSYRGPSWLMAGSGRGNVPVRATCLPSVPPGPLMAPLHLAGVPGQGRELGMRTARQRRGVPSPTGWCRGRDKPVSLCASVLSAGRGGTGGSGRALEMMGVLPSQATMPAPAATGSHSSEPLAILRTPCSVHLAPRPAEPLGNQHRTCPWSQLPVGPNRETAARKPGKPRQGECNRLRPKCPHPTASPGLVPEKSNSKANPGL